MAWTFLLIIRLKPIMLTCRNHKLEYKYFFICVLKNAHSENFQKYTGTYWGWGFVASNFTALRKLLSSGFS